MTVSNERLLKLRKNPVDRDSFENTVRKGEIARNEQFLIFPQCFLPVSRTFCHFHHI